MTPWAKLRRRWREYRRKREDKKYAGTPLREFVYLDEVSVYSLIASRKGPIATDYRDTASTLLRSELEGTVGGNVGMAKSEVASRIESSQTNESQTVGKAIIQSTFRELYQAEQDKLALRPAELADAPRAPTNLEGLRALISARTDSGAWITAPSELTRGQMVELEVELHAHEVFQFGTAVSSILDIIEGNRELLSEIDAQTLRQVVDGNRILQRLLVGLVPLKGRVVRYRSVIVDQQEWFVHEHLLANIDKDQIPMRPIFVVGVAEQQLFWKDIRRVLFSGSRFLVLGRLARDGLNSQWSPVKLIDVLNTIPEVGESVAQAIQVLPTLMRADGEDVPALLAPPSPLSDALAEFGSALADRYGHVYSKEEIADSGVIADPPVPDESTEARIEAFRAIREHVAIKFGIEVDAQMAAELRQDVLRQTGLWPERTDAAPPEAERSGTENQREGGMAERYLDAEFVAVYW
jgi:hypothetical protein